MNFILTIRFSAAIVSLFMAESVSAQTGNLSLSSGSATAAGVVTLPLSLTGGAQPAAIQWTLLYSSDISAVTVTDGPAVVNASKTTTCASSPGKTICLVAGLNQNSVVDGVLANVTLQLAPAVSGASVPVQIVGAAAASSLADAITVASTGATISVAGATPPQISSFVCGSTSISVGTSATCNLTLASAAPAGGVVANLSSTNANLVVPASVTFAGGATSAAFTASVTPGTAVNSAASVTAIIGPSTKSSCLHCNRPTSTHGPDLLQRPGRFGNSGHVHGFAERSGTLGGRTGFFVQRKRRDHSPPQRDSTRRIDERHVRRFGRISIVHDIGRPYRNVFVQQRDDDVVCGRGSAIVHTRRLNRTGWNGERIGSDAHCGAIGHDRNRQCSR